MRNVAGSASRPEASKSRYEIAVVARALDILADLAGGVRHTIASAAAATGTSQATAYRLLVTLEGRGFVEHDRSEHTWGPGSRLFDIAETSTREKLRAIAVPLLARLRDQEMETVNLASFANGELVYIEVLESPLRFRMSGERGERAPLHSTALGRVVLASLPADEQSALLGQLDIAPLTKRTIIDKAVLEEELFATASRGWAEEHGETELGVTCLGGVLLGRSGRPLGAISISVPDARLDEERRRRLGRSISELAAHISTALSRATASDGRGPLRHGSAPREDRTT
jgi:DNA-binding IclR family transcriptional regulator